MWVEARPDAVAALYRKDAQYGDETPINCLKHLGRPVPPVDHVAPDVGERTQKQLEFLLPVVEVMVHRPSQTVQTVPTPAALPSIPKMPVSPTYAFGWDRNAYGRKILRIGRKGDTIAHSRCEGKPMSRWSVQFENHPFQGSWFNLSTGTATAAVLDSSDLATAEELARLRKLISHLSNVLLATDPDLAAMDALGAMTQTASAAAGEVQAYKDNGNPTHLKNANAQADALATHIYRFSQGIVPAGSENVAAAADSLRAYVSQWHQEASSHLEELRGQVSVVEGRSLTADQAIDKLGDRLTAMEGQFQAQLSSFTQTFTTAETSRAERHDKWQETQQTKADESFTTTATKYSVGLDVLADYQDQAKKVLGTVVNTSQAGAYATYANEEKASANSYRRLAILLMGIAALVLFLPELWHIAQTIGGYTVDWQKALYRLPFSLILFAPAVYLAKESTRHRNNEVLNRRRQHILTTIEPYLALLDKQKAEEVKTEVAKSLFTDTIAATGDKDEDTGNVLAQLSNLAATLLKKKG